MSYKNFKATEIIDEIGSELRKIRLEKKYTISYVANELMQTGLHISNTLLGRIENGERRIDDETLTAICNFYNIDANIVVIEASKKHILKLSSDQKPNSTTSSEEDILALFNNLNTAGQKEVSQLMRLMAYMDAYKK